MTARNDSYHHNRQMLDAAMLELAEDLCTPVSQLMRSATASGAWSLDDLPEGVRGQVVSADDVAGSRDLTLLLGIVLDAWEPVFSQPFGQFEVTYQLVDKVRHVRNDYAHVSADFGDESYVTDARQAIANLRECVIKWSQAQGFVVEAVGRGSTFAPVAVLSPAQQHYQIGLGYYNQRQFDLAIANFNRAINLERNYVEAYNERALAFVEVKRYKDAVSDLRRVTNLSPNWVIGWNNLGYAYESGRSYNSAVSAYESAIALDPQYLVPWNNMGRMYYQRAAEGGKDALRWRRQSVRVFSRAIAANPRVADLYSRRAACYAVLGQYKEAIADVDYALTLQPGAEDLLQQRKAIVGVRRNRRIGLGCVLSFLVIMVVGSGVFVTVMTVLDAW